MLPQLNSAVSRTSEHSCSKKRREISWFGLSTPHINTTNTHTFAAFQQISRVKVSIGEWTVFSHRSDQGIDNAEFIFPARGKIPMHSNNKRENSSHTLSLSRGSFSQENLFLFTTHTDTQTHTAAVGVFDVVNRRKNSGIYVSTACLMCWTIKLLVRLPTIPSGELRVRERFWYLGCQRAERVYGRGPKKSGALKVVGKILFFERKSLKSNVLQSLFYDWFSSY